MRRDRGRRRSRRPWIVGGGIVLLLVLVVSGAAAIKLAKAARDLRDAQNLVDEAAIAIEDGRLAAARAALDEASAIVVRTNGNLYGGPELDFASRLPVVGGNLESIRDSVGLAALIIDGGERILQASIPLESPSGTLEVSLSDGSIPLDAVSAAAREVSSLASQLPANPPSAPALLLGPTKELRERVYAEADRRRAQLDVLGRGLTLLNDLAGGDGPRRYLLAIANTAEMRGAGGMILNYGVLEGRDGVIDLTAFGRTTELVVPAPVDADLVPPDYLRRWSGFDPLQRWTQATLAGDFTVVAPVLEELYTASTGAKVDGVIQVDPSGLAAILDGVGPVTVPEIGQVTGADVERFTLNEAYFRFPGIEERSDVLGDVAEAAFRRLVDGEVPSLRTLATRLVEAVDARHVIMRSDNSELQSTIAAFGADGAYPPVDGGDAIALTAQNLSGNKLDYYLDTALTLTGTRAPGALGELTAQVRLSNTAPQGATSPSYVFGPFPGAVELPAGVLRSLVTLYLPVGSSIEATGGDALVEPVSFGTEDGRPYVSFIVDVPAGEARTVDLGLRLAPRPVGAYQLVIVPSSRVRPTTVSVDIDAGTARLEAEIPMDRTWVVAPGRDAISVPGPVFR